MKVAWVTHRNLHSEVGGAEAADREMIERRPDGVEVLIVSPGGVGPDLMDEVDKVIATGFYGFTSREMNELGRMNPVIWSHDTMYSGHWIMLEASKLILLTPQHEEYERQKNPMIQAPVFLNPGHLDTANLHFPDMPRQPWALWAHRPTPGKGLDLAAEWSTETGNRLLVMVNEPRPVVIDAMKTSSWFVLLSHDMDPGPRAVMEAQLCGCKLAINDNVGFYDEDPDQLRARLDTAAQDFWEVALN